MSRPLNCYNKKALKIVTGIRGWILSAVYTRELPHKAGIGRGVNKPLTTCMLNCNCLPFFTENHSRFLGLPANAGLAALSLSISSSCLSFYFLEEKMYGKEELPGFPNPSVLQRQLQHISVLVQVSPGLVSIFFLDKGGLAVCSLQKTDSLNSFSERKIRHKEMKQKKIWKLDSLGENANHLSPTSQRLHPDSEL